MDFDKYCRRCKHYQFNPINGIICGLTSEHPDFGDDCSDYEYDAIIEKTLSESYESVKPTQLMHREPFAGGRNKSLSGREYVKRNGKGMVILGIISIIFSNFVSAEWGILIMILGFTNLIYPKIKMIKISGILLIAVGFLNFIVSFIDEFSAFWIILGISQVYWGVLEFKKYRKYFLEESEESVDPIEAKESENPNSTLVVSKSDLGIISCLIFALVMVFLLVFFMSSIFYTTNNADTAEIDPNNFDLSGGNIIMAMAGLLLFIMGMVTPFIGIAFGIAGLYQKDKSNVFSISGILLNLGILVLSYSFILVS